MKNDIFPLPNPYDTNKNLFSPLSSPTPLTTYIFTAPLRSFFKPVAHLAQPCHALTWPPLAHSHLEAGHHRPRLPVHPTAPEKEHNLH